MLYHLCVDSSLLQIFFISGVDLEAIKKDSSSSETEKPTPEAEIVQDEAPKPEETPEPEKPAEVYRKWKK